MSAQITFTLSDPVYDRARHLSQVTGRSLQDILADTLDLSLPSLSSPAQISAPASMLSDQDVLKLADMQLTVSQDQRLSELLERQQAGLLTDAARAELSGLMQVYQTKLLQKAQALHEAVRRGLREPLSA
jgi:hypothetical protein